MEKKKKYKSKEGENVFRQCVNLTKPVQWRHLRRCLYFLGFVCNLHLHISVGCFVLASKGSLARKESFLASNIFLTLMIKETFYVKTNERIGVIQL